MNIFNAVILSMQFSEWYWAARTITGRIYYCWFPYYRQCLVPLCMSFWGRYGVASQNFYFLEFFKTNDCDNCDACLRVCEMGTRPNEMNCTNCGDCLHVCHKDAIRFGRKG